MTTKKAKYGKAHGEKNGNQAEMVRGGAGDWEIRPNGKFFDPKRKKWVIRCRQCRKTFYASRVNAQTCGNKCRTAYHRQQKEQSL